ncbi:MAG: hypothetical protein HOM55_09695 [Proteobacteria bacterium]|jgi:hypothetical protein|nr:hypothetical protein [Pseudomonadota bacterium]
MLQNFIDWASSTAVNSWVLSNAWAWPAMETLHFFGLCLMLGALLIIDTRLMGYFKSVSFDAVHKLLPWAFIGFAINLITGLVFLFGDPARYVPNIGFRLKLILIVLGGLNAAYYYWKLHGRLGQLEVNGDATSLAKLVGSASLVFWFGVLIMGRLIPYVGTG